MKPVPEGVDGLSESEKTRYSIDVDAETGKQTVMCCRDEDYATEIAYLRARSTLGLLPSSRRCFSIRKCSEFLLKIAVRQVLMFQFYPELCVFQISGASSA